MKHIYYAIYIKSKIYIHKNSLVSFDVDMVLLLDSETCGDHGSRNQLNLLRTLNEQP